MADPLLGIPCLEKQCLCCILDPWKIVSSHRKLTLCPYIHKAKKLPETNFQPRKIGRKNLDEKILRQSALIMKMWQPSLFSKTKYDISMCLYLWAFWHCFLQTLETLDFGCIFETKIVIQKKIKDSFIFESQFWEIAICWETRRKRQFEDCIWNEILRGKFIQIFQSGPWWDNPIGHLLLQVFNQKTIFSGNWKHQWVEEVQPFVTHFIGKLKT